MAYGIEEGLIHHSPTESNEAMLSRDSVRISPSAARCPNKMIIVVVVVVVLVVLVQIGKTYQNNRHNYTD
jgi:hypothetical protein